MATITLTFKDNAYPANEAEQKNFLRLCRKVAGQPVTLDWDPAATAVAVAAETEFSRVTLNLLQRLVSTNSSCLATATKE